MSVKSQNLVRTTLPGWCGLGGFFFSIWVLHFTNDEPYIKAAITIGSIFMVMFCAEVFLCIRGNFGLIAAPSQRRIDVRRVLFKISGLIITVLCLSSIYWVFYGYYNHLYKPYFQALAVGWPYLAAFFIFCIVWSDQRSDEHEDANYWIAYAVFNFKFKLLKNTNLKQHILEWLIKIYFLPLMFVALADHVNFYFNINNACASYNTFCGFIFFIDTAFASVGYLFANNLTDTHVRSADPTLLGWACTLICYDPFWTLFGAKFLSYGSAWGLWFYFRPALQIIWAVLIGLCLTLYVWATISFGTRFSNLTHRGILTGGPYAYMRHPAYIGKMCSFFLIYVPFMGTNIIVILRNCFLWGLLGGIYYLRAKTEEANLRSMGPEYDIYATEVRQNWKKLLRFENLLFTRRYFM
ncbi:MAG: hypothetical protein KGJ09_07885 [Candidatus Omnitrophica bacterium]|nr:hypothetical protein [Candidatus Omnitrophota bacterium]MDE2009981.1 hypothetical protein [Candidatus Omnitrophota bacterium]MDE2213959.1 hypothetical protein [Candidatus Omnitrophota bacterium]MDE2231891.1 hypothetical protein [Candidatus Omnitrophota bacterium]